MATLATLACFTSAQPMYMMASKLPNIFTKRSVKGSQHENASPLIRRAAAESNIIDEQALSKRNKILARATPDEPYAQMTQAVQFWHKLHKCLARKVS